MGLVVAVLGGVLVPLYWLTLAPHATWANLGSDSGELIAVAVVRGVPHPTGYPTYLLLLHLLELLPLPIPSTAPALRYGLLSVLSATATAIGIALAVLRLPPATPPPCSPAPARYRHPNGPKLCHDCSRLVPSRHCRGV